MPRSAPIPLNIAVIEDHADLQRLLVAFLQEQGHLVRGFSCADDLAEDLQAHSIDVLVLDLNLPGETGYSIAQRLRAAHPDLHIIMTTARSALEDRIKGYASGANLYLTKPVEPGELASVITGIAQRIQLAQSRQTQLVLTTRQLRLSGPASTLSLTPPEVMLLKTLAEAAGHKLDYWRLFELLGIEPDEKNKNALEVRMSRLKKKLHDAGAPEPAIKSVWKVGYQLCVTVRVEN